MAKGKGISLIYSHHTRDGKILHFHFPTHTRTRTARKSQKRIELI